MRIAVLIDTWVPFIGGGQINAWEISRRIAQKGIPIEIITRNNGREDLKYPKNLKVIKLGPRTKAENVISKLTFLIRSFFYIYRRDYDLVHAHAFLPGITARLLMVFKGIPAILTVHGTSINTKLNNIFSRWLEKCILTQIFYSAQITVSRDFLEIQNINKQRFSSNKKVFYVPNGINIKDFDKVRSTKLDIPTLIFVGRLHPQKNLSTLIDAINDVKTKIPEINLLIVGKGPEEQELKAKVKTLRLQKHIKFLGEVIGKDLIKLYKSSYIFILPSIYEGQPLTLLEAWAAKLPVTVSNTGDCVYLVKDGINGYIIDNQSDPEDIARIIKKALSNKNLEKLGHNGYNFVKKNFSWDKSAELTMEVYKSVIAKN